MKAIVCGPSVYGFRGWVFEVHSFCGPWPLKKDMELRKRAGKRFWDVWAEWDRLTSKEKKDTQLHQGGCQLY